MLKCKERSNWCSQEKIKLKNPNLLRVKDIGLKAMERVKAAPSLYLNFRIKASRVLIFSQGATRTHFPWHSICVSFSCIFLMTLTVSTIFVGGFLYSWKSLKLIQSRNAVVWNARFHHQDHLDFVKHFNYLLDNF